MLLIQAKAIFVGSHSFMSFVQRYLAPVRRVYSVIKQEALKGGVDEALQITLISVSDTAEANGLVPTLLFYKKLPRLGLLSNPPAPSTFR